MKYLDEYLFRTGHYDHPLRPCPFSHDYPLFDLSDLCLLMDHVRHGKLKMCWSRYDVPLRPGRCGTDGPTGGGQGQGRTGESDVRVRE